MSNQPRLNKYTCQECEGIVITVDREEGVTPFIIACRAPRDEGLACMGRMTSSMYRDVEGEPTFEWRRPTDAEYAELDVATREQHVDRGGLLIYPISNAIKTGRK